jgi:hypothetical protein
MDNMKQDRFLIGILIGIVALVVISLGLFFLRKDSENYVEENAPENIVHNYVVAIHKGDFEKAYSYLSEGVNKPTYEVFRKALLPTWSHRKMSGWRSAAPMFGATMPPFRSTPSTTPATRSPAGIATMTSRC